MLLLAIEKTKTIICLRRRSRDRADQFVKRFMLLNNASREIIDLFWSRAGNPEPFPRSMERSVLLALPIAIIKLPRLTVQKIETWVFERGAEITLGCADRALRGCLIVRNGSGFIFVDGTDSDDEQRFTISHEVGHFLVDYWLPRQRAMSKLGHSVSEVFDGVRKPSVKERIVSIISGTELGSIVRLMERGDSLDCSKSETWKSEEEADKIGLSLLAPADAVLGQTGVNQTRYLDRLASVTSSLRVDFGLPEVVSERYARTLLRSIGKGPSWLENFM